MEWIQEQEVLEKERAKHQKKIESKKLSVELNDLKDEEDVLKSEVNKLKDPVYIGKYAREKLHFQKKMYHR